MCVSGAVSGSDQQVQAGCHTGGGATSHSSPPDQLGAPPRGKGNTGRELMRWRDEHRCGAGGQGVDDQPLPTEYRHPGNDRRRTALAAVAGERGLRRGQVVLAWLTGSQPSLTPIVGVSSVEQVDQAWTGATTRLTEQELAALNAA